MAIVLAKTAWRDYSTDGVPGSGAYKPDKAPIRSWGARVEGLDVTGDYVILNADNGKVIRCNGDTFDTITLGAYAGYDSDFTCVVQRMPSTRGIKFSPNGLSSEVYYPGQCAFVRKASGVWEVSKVGRWRLPGNTVLNVATTGAALNDGLATGASGALDLASTGLLVAQRNIEFNNKALNIRLAAGTYADAVAWSGLDVGGAGIGELIVEGDPAGAASAVIINSPSTLNTFDVQLNGVLKVQHLKANAQGGGASIMAASRGGKLSFDEVIFGDAVLAHVLAERGGYIEHGPGAANCSIAAPVSVTPTYHTLARARGLIMASTVNAGALVFLGNITFSIFAYNSSMGDQDWTGKTISLGGFTVTGKRYQSDFNSLLNTNGGGANYFPGNSAGSVASGGVYN